MKTLTFKTTIKCAGCIAQSTPFLNEAAGVNNWEVDVKDEKKLLTVRTSDNVEPETIIRAVERAGYTAERI
jgi:copper chaperone